LTDPDEIPPEILLLGILDELQDPMCRIITEHVPAYEKIQDWVVDLGVGREAAEKKIIPLDEVDKLFVEYGCTICDMGLQGHKLTDRPPRATLGTRVSIQTVECKKAGGKPVGAYHTHPFTLPIPSQGDIENHFRQGRLVDFVGGRVGKRDVLIGYGSHSQSKIRYEIESKIGPFPQRDWWKGTSKAIFLQVRPPGSRWVEGSEQVKSIPVYDDITRLQRFWEQVATMKRVFEVIVRWC